MLSGSKIIAFVAATDMARAQSFYQGVLGLKLKGEDGFALVFDCNGTMLRVTKVKEAIRAPYTILGWSVQEIRKDIEHLQGKGLLFERFPGLGQDDLGVWAAPDGTQVAWFKDPEGNLLSLTEFPR